MHQIRRLVFFFVRRRRCSKVLMTHWFSLVYVSPFLAHPSIQVSFNLLPVKVNTEVQSPSVSLSPFGRTDNRLMMIAQLLHRPSKNILRRFLVGWWCFISAACGFFFFFASIRSNHHKIATSNDPMINRKKRKMIQITIRGIDYDYM